ncbi:protein of unknown function [Candidatus Nitrosotalea okcheonensis]|uniref:Uncharacterized protein n=1 Tax=Candidatus Nitrosotalea okcheonensis TaxID=1903276 RepID=A0A2H1FDA4_9ARCH|nr:protein of unknown function [Candidatus Nitrosotalea okcheonensis]
MTILYKSIEPIFFLHFMQCIDIIFDIKLVSIRPFYKDQRSIEFDKKLPALDTLLYLMRNFVSKHEI